MNIHDRVVTPDTDPDRFTDEEVALFRAGKCGEVVEYGNGRGVIHCGAPSRPGASFGSCEEHEAEMLECHFSDGTPRYQYAEEQTADPEYNARADRAAEAHERAERSRR
jgi:hypothetical protein